MRFYNHVRVGAVIREVARILSDECKRRVVIVDTSNEIGGDSNISHPGVGSARRMQVPLVEQQHRVMIEACPGLSRPALLA